MQTALLIAVALNFALEVAAILYRRKVRHEEERAEIVRRTWNQAQAAGMRFAARLQRDADLETDPARASELRVMAAQVSVIAEKARR